MFMRYDDVIGSKRLKRRIIWGCAGFAAGLIVGLMLGMIY
jgi:hypothetical protein